MVFLFILIVLAPVVVAVIRRAGFAGWLALLLGMIVLGGDPADPLGAGIVAAVSFVGCRLAQSWIRRHGSDGRSVRGKRAAGRGVSGVANLAGRADPVSEDEWYPRSPPPPPLGAFEPRRRCRGRRR